MRLNNILNTGRKMRAFLSTSNWRDFHGACTKPFIAFISLLLIALLSGCGSQAFNLDYTPEQQPKMLNGYALTVEVLDHRPEVLDGEKPGAYIGEYKFSGDVLLPERSLAQQLQLDVQEDLESQGYKIMQSSISKALIISVQEWAFDDLDQGAFRFKLQLTVTDSNEIVLTTGEMAHGWRFDANPISGPKASIEENLPGLYARIIRGIVRDNQKVKAALSSF